VWGSACTSYTDGLFLLQKKAIRIVTYQGSQDHTNKVFIKLQTLKFKELVRFKMLQIMWRVKNNLVQTHIKNKFMLITDRNRRKGNFSVPYSRTSQKQKGFLVTGIYGTLWTGVKSSNTIVQFNKMYKKNYVLGKI